MSEEMRRISLMLREDQYQRLSDAGLNVSGFIRDLIDDHFSEHTITLGVSDETRALYNQVVANTGATDTDLEPFLRESLKNMLDTRIREMQRLQKELSKKR